MSDERQRDAEGQDCFFSCDWGTSSFRLRLVSSESRAIVAEVWEPTGARVMYDAVVSQGVTGEEFERVRGESFATFLRSRLEAMAGSVAGLPREIPVVISGMATSTVGWVEVPYREIPWSLADLDLNCAWRELVGAEGRRYRVALLGGLRSPSDMMRGEEIEAAGLVERLGSVEGGETFLLVLPGTHSKHLRVRSGEVVAIRTHMTGELLALMATESLLKVSVEPPQKGTSPGADELRAFLEGVDWVRSQGLSGSLFRVRTRAVLDGNRPRENWWFLAGLLVGAEAVEAVRMSGADPVVVAASPSLGPSYEGAFRAVCGEKRVIVVDPAEVGRASVWGHAAWLDRRRLSKEIGR